MFQIPTMPNFEQKRPYESALNRLKLKGKLSKIQISCSILSNFSTTPDCIAIIVYEGALSWVGPDQVSPARMVVNIGRS